MTIMNSGRLFSKNVWIFFEKSKNIYILFIVFVGHQFSSLGFKVEILIVLKYI